MNAASPFLSWRRDAGDRRAIGEKAEGLLSLPLAWVPPFASLGGDLVRTMRSEGAARALAALPEAVQAETERRLIDPCDHLVIRSDGSQERGRPGAGLSVACESSWASLGEALDYYLRGGESGLPFVQAGVEPALLGVMSNERRHTRRKDTWLIEGILGTRAPQARRVRTSRKAPRHGALRVRTRPQLLARLREVAAALERDALRVRCEWVWDGERLWIVQADPQPAAEMDVETTTYFGGRDAAGVALPAPDAPPRRSRFSKLRSRAEFAGLQMPLAPLVAFDGEEWLDGRARAALVERAMSGGQVVVRTDVAGRRGPFLLPTSEPTRSARRATRFIERSLLDLVERGIGHRDVLFLISPLVAARASALVHADARHGDARLDAIWGFPDGLLNLPHDSFTYQRGEISRRDIRHKPAALLLDEQGTRRVTLSGPFDWEACLRADEIRQVSEWGLRLSRSRGAPIQLMALCRIGGARGANACMPFHAWKARRDGHDETLVSPRIDAVIRRRGDLRQKVSPGSTVRLDLEEELDRDVGFLDRVGRWAAGHGVTLAFAGSRLGHTRAVLERSGAIVVSPGQSGLDWSDYWPAVIGGGAEGLRRVRMVRRDSLKPRELRPSRYPGITEVNAAAEVEILGGDLPGQPGLFIGNASTR